MCMYYHASLATMFILHAPMKVKDQAVTCHAEESDKNKKFDYYSLKSSDLKPKAIKKVSSMYTFS